MLDRYLEQGISDKDILAQRCHRPSAAMTEREKPVRKPRAETPSSDSYLFCDLSILTDSLEVIAETAQGKKQTGTVRFSGGLMIVTVAGIASSHNDPALATKAIGERFGAIGIELHARFMLKVFVTIDSLQRKFAN